ncbi:hypothetical protein [Sandaracinus amylolyticus]|uniref:hypothetical protein n=1 Tax=Sandaracinus amylolyticus TaxID=927083 RepID=UPI0012ECE241|nr:hypothetical protein [Sandaracinus amylolyticus]
MVLRAAELDRRANTGSHRCAHAPSSRLHAVRRVDALLVSARIDCTPTRARNTDADHALTPIAALAPMQTRALAVSVRQTQTLRLIPTWTPTLIPTLTLAQMPTQTQTQTPTPTLMPTLMPTPTRTPMPTPTLTLIPTRSEI